MTRLEAACEVHVCEGEGEALRRDLLARIAGVVISTSPMLSNSERWVRTYPMREPTIVPIKAQNTIEFDVSSEMPRRGPSRLTNT